MNIRHGIPKEMRIEAITWAFEYFKYVTPKDYFFAILQQETNWGISAILLDEEDKIMGLYLLGDKQLDSLTLNEKYVKLKGVEGVLLAVSEEVRGQGWGNKLKDYPKTLEFDYIWGQQLKTLNNLEDWLKRRELIAETKSVYITAEVFL
jgi:hypothetical protein